MSCELNPILTSGNAFQIVTNFEAAPQGISQLTGIPLGTSDGTATGEIVVKTLAYSPGGSSSNQVQGTAADNAAAVGNPVQSGGVAADVSNLPTFATGDIVALRCNESDGTLLVTQGNLEQSLDAVTAWAPQSSTANTPSIVTSAGTAISANASRKKWGVKNLGTNPLFVRLGASASTSVFHFLLKAGTADDDGLGGEIHDDSWVGVVSVAGTSPRFTVYETT